MTYRTAENLIREIMASKYLKEDVGQASHMNPANKTSDEERVKAALKVLHDNGCPSAKAKDNGIEVDAVDANRAADVLDHALAKNVIEVRPTLVSAEAIPTPVATSPALTGDVVVPEPIDTPVKEEAEQIDEAKTVFHVENGKTTVHLGDNHERVWTHNGHDLYRNKEDDKDHMLLRRDHSVHSMFHGDTDDVKNVIKDAGLPALRKGLKEDIEYHLHELSTETLHKVANVARKKGRKDVLNAAIKAGQRKRAQPEYKFAGEEIKVDISAQQLDELSLAALMDYKKAAAKSVKPTDVLTKKLDKRLKGIGMAKSKIAKTVSKAMFGEESTPMNMILRLRKNLSEDARDGDPKPKLRLKATIVSDSGKHTAKIYKDQDWSEHRVKFFIHGKHHEPADYHTSDYHDAHGTANLELKRLDKLNGALKESTEEEINALLEDYEQIDELSKALLGRYISRAAPSLTHHAERTTNLEVASQTPKHSRARDYLPSTEKNADGKWLEKKAMKKASKTLNREHGIQTAAAKMTGQHIGPYRSKMKVNATEEVVKTDTDPFQNSQND